MVKDLKSALLFDFYNGLLTDKQSEIIDLYYNEDLSLAEISSHLGITRQGVHDNIKRAEAVMAEADAALGLVGKYYETEKAIENIYKIIDELSENTSGEVLKKLCEIKQNLKVISE